MIIMSQYQDEDGFDDTSDKDDMKAGCHAEQDDARQLLPSDGLRLRLLHLRLWSVLTTACVLPILQ